MSKRRSFTCSDEEWDELVKRTEDAGLSSVSAYLRTLISAPKQTEEKVVRIPDGFTCEITLKKVK